MKIKKVAVIGGTHGNEVTGTYLLRRWAEKPGEILRSSFETKTLWANPKAFRENKRYIDADLNRSFSLAELGDETIDTYEGNRAKVINSFLGPKGKRPAFDFAFDIHTSTSNMGATLILVGSDRYQLRMAAFIKAHMDNVNLYYFEGRAEDYPNLSTVVPRRLGLEIGPIPQGLLRHDIFEQANTVLQLGLDYIDKVNRGERLKLDKQVEVYVHRSVVEYPTDSDGNITALVHKNLQDNDFAELKRGDPMFMRLTGETICYDKRKLVYPAFINEAAYYPLRIAFMLTEKQKMATK